MAFHYAAAPDGQRFLVNSTADEAPVCAVTIVLNWSAALSRSAIDVPLASRPEFWSRSITVVFRLQQPPRARRDVRSEPEPIGPPAICQVLSGRGS